MYYKNSSTQYIYSHGGPKAMSYSLGLPKVGSRQPVLKKCCLTYKSYVTIYKIFQHVIFYVDFHSDILGQPAFVCGQPHFVNGCPMRIAIYVNKCVNVYKCIIQAKIDMIMFVLCLSVLTFHMFYLSVPIPSTPGKWADKNIEKSSQH